MAYEQCSTAHLRELPCTPSKEKLWNTWLHSQDVAKPQLRPTYIFNDSGNELCRLKIQYLILD